MAKERGCVYRGHWSRQQQALWQHTLWHYFFTNISARYWNYGTIWKNRDSSFLYLSTHGADELVLGLVAVLGDEGLVNTLLAVVMTTTQLYNRWTEDV